jgi:hypothetical protein
MTSITPEFKKLPGRYKGTRRRREPPIVAECECGWKSRPLSPKKAEKRFAAHVAMHGGQRMSPAESRIVLQAVQALNSDTKGIQPA